MPLTSRILGCFLAIAMIAVIPLDSFFHRSNTCDNYEVPGVSFDLTPSYGTAAVHFSDGTSVAVAKVEGNSVYKAFMRREGTIATQWSAGWTSLVHTATFPLLEIYERLWKQLDTPQGFDNTAVRQLLQTLKTAAETYLGHSICLINVALPRAGMSCNYQKNVISQAVHQIGLAKVVELTYDAGKVAMIGNGLANFTEPRKLVLVIDNSYYGYNLGLFFRDDVSFEEIRHNYQPHIRKGQNQTLSIQQALEAITKPPFGRLPVVGDLPRNIGELVLYGNNIWDAEFHMTLESVLDPQLISKARKYQPVYSAALGLAEATFIQLNEPMSGKRKRAQFGCCWKSTGRACPRI